MISVVDVFCEIVDKNKQRQQGASWAVTTPPPGNNKETLHSYQIYKKCKSLSKINVNAGIY